MWKTVEWRNVQNTPLSLLSFKSSIGEIGLETFRTMASLLRLLPTVDELRFHNTKEAGLKLLKSVKLEL